MNVYALLALIGYPLVGCLVGFTAALRMSREANRTGASILAGVLWPVTVSGFVLIWYIEVLTPYAERCWDRLTDVPATPPPDPYLLAASEEIDRILNPDKDKAA